MIVKQVPVNIEPLDKLQERFVEALDPIYDGESLFLNAVCGPSFYRRHIFDFGDGIRIVVARLLSAQDGDIKTFYRARINDASHLATDLVNGKIEPNVVIGMFHRHFCELVNLPAPPGAIYLGSSREDQSHQFLINDPQDLMATIHKFKYGNDFSD